MKRTSILVVEDEVLIAEEIITRLLDMGFEVPATSTRGDDAITKAEEHHPDLVLMDINLEGEMDGIEAARHIRTNLDIPVVFLTAFSDDETLKRAQETDPNGYITKPFKDRQLYITIKIALQKHEKETRTKKEIETLDVVKNDIISNVSHELKTPLTIAYGALEVLNDEVNEGSREFLYIAKNALERQNNIIGDLVRLAQVQKNKMQLDIRKVNLPDMIAPLVEKVKPRADKKDIKIISDIPYIEVPIDKGDIETALLNLLDNAVKFNKDNGEVMVSAKEFGNTVIISILDTGIGIPEEYTDKIFDKFYQVDSSSTRCYGGTGSGLAVVKEIVELHGGSIWVESDPGIGSTFNIAIPRVRGSDIGSLDKGLVS